MELLRLILTLGLATPPALEAPAGGVEVLEAIPFRCNEPWPHFWSAERPAVDAGTILVARLDPAAIRARASAMPVLMVGEEIAEIVNPGNEEGIVIAVVPAPAAWPDDGVPTLAGREVFLSAPGLADRIEIDERKARRETARSEGIAPQPASDLPPLRRLAGREDLDRELAAIVRRRCPAQSRLADLLDGTAADPLARDVIAPAAAPVAPPALEPAAIEPAVE